MPAMGALLAVILIALALDYRSHRRSLPLAIAIPAALALYFFVFIHRVNLAVYMALSVLILGRILNFIFVRRGIRPSRGRNEEGRPGIGLATGQTRTDFAELRQTSGH